MDAPSLSAPTCPGPSLGVDINICSSRGPDPLVVNLSGPCSKVKCFSTPTEDQQSPEKEKPQQEQQQLKAFTSLLQPNWKLKIRHEDSTQRKGNTVHMLSCFLLKYLIGPPYLPGAKRTRGTAPAGADVWSDTSTAVKTRLFAVSWEITWSKNNKPAVTVEVQRSSR